MSTVEVPVLSYDEEQVELGFSPWQTFISFMREQELHESTIGKVATTLARSSFIANQRFLNPEYHERAFERPFLFIADTDIAFDQRRLEKVSIVDIALDTLHGFIVAEAFIRKTKDQMDYRNAVYCYRVGSGIRKPIIEFVNAHISSIAS